MRRGKAVAVHCGRSVEIPAGTGWRWNGLDYCWMCRCVLLLLLLLLLLLPWPASLLLFCFWPALSMRLIRMRTGLQATGAFRPAVLGFNAFLV